MPKSYQLANATSLSGRNRRGPVPDWEREFDRRLGRNLIAARKAKRLKGAEFARLLGVGVVSYWNWEQGIYRVGVARLQLIANALGVTATSLIPELSDLNPCAEGEK